MPVPGDPGTVREVARAIQALGIRVAGTGRVLRGVVGAPGWDGSAAAEFSARVSAVAPVLDAAAHRYAGAATVLGRFADALERAQELTNRSSAERESALAGALRIETAVERVLDAGAARDAPEVQALLTAQRAETERQVRAEVAHQRAWAAYEEEDRACALELRRLAVDRLVDGVAYRALTGVSGGAAAAATSLTVLSVDAPPLATVAAAASLVGTTADTVLLAGWGDGDVGQIAFDGVLGSLAAGGLVLSMGARVSSGAEELGTLTTRGRVVAGVRGAARERVDALGAAVRELGAAPSAATVPAAAAPTTVAGTGARAGAARAVALARARADAAFLSDWRVITSRGAASDAPRMAVTGSALNLVHQAGAAARSADQAAGTAQDLRQPTPRNGGLPRSTLPTP